MRHLNAVEVDLGDRGQGWHYASVNRRGGGPIGFCAEHPPHPTEDDARRCYRAFQRSQIRLDCRFEWTRCQYRHNGARCPKPADRGAKAGPYDIAPLCEEHLTLEGALVALRLEGDLAGEGWES